LLSSGIGLVRWQLEKLRALPPALGTVQALVADSGFMSETAPEVEDATPIAPLIALGRAPSHRSFIKVSPTGCYST